MQAFCHPLHSSKLACSSLKPYKPIDLRPRFSRTVRCYSQMDGRGVPSTTLLDSLKADKEFAQHLTAQQSFDTVLDMHMTLHDLVNQAVPLKLAPTQVSNDQGVLLHRSTGAGPLKQGTLRVQASESRAMYTLRNMLYIGSNSVYASTPQATTVT